MRNSKITVNFIQNSDKTKKSFIQTIFKACLSKNHITNFTIDLTKKAATCLYSLRLLANTSVDSADPRHCRLLEIYFSSFISSQPMSVDQINNYSSPVFHMPDVPDQHWILAGFQSANPFTDFRGCGLFGLYLLAYAASKYPHQLQHIMLSSFSLTDKNGNLPYKSMVILNNFKAYKNTYNFAIRELCSTVNYHPFTATFLNVAYNIYCYIGADYMDINNLDLDQSNYIKFYTQSTNTNNQKFRIGKVASPSIIQRLAEKFAHQPGVAAMLPEAICELFCKLAFELHSTWISSTSKEGHAELTILLSDVYKKLDEFALS